MVSKTQGTEATKSIASGEKRVVPIPIGMDHLSFKMDSAIMNQL
jgi:hypothetical protein